MQQSGYFYIMTITHNSVLYYGATTDLYNRVLEHRNKIFQNSFTSRYNIDKLVYFEAYTFAGDAFQREKQMKAGSRKKKIDLIRSINPQWEDLFQSWQMAGSKNCAALKSTINSWGVCFARLSPAFVRKMLSKVVSNIFNNCIGWRVPVRSSFIIVIPQCLIITNDVTTCINVIRLVGHVWNREF
ncbi:MAG: GIY-YIG nuclease family protein [Bacteroidetes bacterium]|nr:MAG: GIY-YIG nuclease family protein [Bacteroidota bacterium]